MSKYLKMTIVGVTTALAASVGVAAQVTAAPTHSPSGEQGIVQPMRVGNWCC